VIVILRAGHLASAGSNVIVIAPAARSGRETYAHPDDANGTRGRSIPCSSAAVSRPAGSRARAPSTSASVLTHHVIQVPPVSSSQTWRGMGPARALTVGAQVDLRFLVAHAAEAARVTPGPPFFHLIFSSLVKLSSRLDTLRIGVSPCTFVAILTESARRPEMGQAHLRRCGSGN
jgi:hypothetical protein